jgi:outer membrane receptor for ferric coprogen and ferric-rhodotorulic acid
MRLPPAGRTGAANDAEKGSMMKSSRTFFLLGSACMALLHPALAQAQDAAAGDGTDGEIVVTGKYTLEDRIDTATGLGLTLRETPQSVSVVTAQRILDQNLTTIADVITNAVGVAVNEVDDVRNNFYARGFEIRNYQVDGVPTAWALAGANGETIADVSIYERVEIVRGATGLLSGAGDPSASVNLVRKHADSTDWTGYVNASYGSWETWRVSGDVGGAVTSDGRVRVRAVGRYEQGKSYIDLYDNQKFVLYGVVDADITENTLLRAGISHQEGQPSSSAWGALPSFYTDGSFIVWPRSRSTSADWSYWNTSNQNIFATVSHDLGNGWSATFNYNRLKNTQSSQLLYMYGLVDKATGTIESSNPYKAMGDSVQNSFDAQIKGRLSLFGRDHELVLGGLHSVLNRHDDTFAARFPEDFPSNVQFVNWTGQSFPLPPFSTTPFRAVQERIEQKGIYGALRLNVTDQLKLIGGGRLSSWQQNGFAYAVTNNYGNDSIFIPYVGALYDITPNHRFYASYTQIFQPQNYLGRDFRNIEPIDGKAYEIGLKSGFFNEALQTSIALFRIDQNNVVDTGTAVVETSPPPGVLPRTTYLTADGTRSEGFELEITGEPIENWNVNFGFSAFKLKDPAGKNINTDQPRTLLKFFTTYRIPIGESALTLGGGVNYRSKAYSDGTNPGNGAPFRFQQDAYTLVNLMARYEINESIQVQANIENLLDETYYSQMGFFSQYRYGAPRNYTIGATYRF